MTPFDRFSFSLRFSPGAELSGAAGFCANASDGILTAHPNLKGENLQEIKGKKGFPLGQEIMRTAAEGEIKEVTYWWPRPGSDKPLEKRTFYTKVGDQNCGVGYYKE